MGIYETKASLSGTLSLQVVEGTSDYDKLDNLPTINGVVVKGDLTSKDLGIERGYDVTYDAEKEQLKFDL